MAFEISHDRTAPISEEEKAQNKGWLIDIMNERYPETRSEPRIQQVVRTLREIKSNETCFDPLVVSFGPYHHGKKRLMPMESCKNAAVRWFVSICKDKPAENVYDEFVVKATSVSSPRECYADKFLHEFQFNEFTRMMFRDGCFILHFIHLVRSDDLSKYSYLNVPLILRDMFLLENQIPYSILSALMSLMPDQSDESRQRIEKKDIGAFIDQRRQSIEKKDIGAFIDQVFLPQENEYSNSSKTSAWPGISSLFRKMLTYCKGNEVSRGEGSNSVGKVEDSDPIDSDPIHLLDFFRSRLVGKAPSSGRGYCLNYYFRSIMELKAAGIEVSPSNSKCLRDIKYKEKLIYGHLELPQIMVDDATKTRLLNLIAYEMCPDGLSDRMVTSYICFLDSLIDHAEDVKELRSKNILLNRLGSDEEVANLFNELANNLTPNSNTYSDVMQDIQNHSSSHVKVWVAEFMHTHFTSPWTVMALMAAIFVIALTVVQTVYSVVGYY